MIAFSNFKFISLIVLPVAIGSSQSFLAPNPYSSAQLRSELDGILGEVLGPGHGVTENKLAKIRQGLAPMFTTLPKNKRGRISSSIMRYAVSRYFNQHYAWTLKGFEPENLYHAQTNASESLPTNIIQSKLPEYMQMRFEQRFAHEGFALEDLVALIVAIDRLTFDEVVRGAELAFGLNDFVVGQTLDANQLYEVLFSYLIVQILDGPTEKEDHLQVKNEARSDMDPSRSEIWDRNNLFLRDISGSDTFEQTPTTNPFIEKKFSFVDAVRMAERINHEFGPVSNDECHTIKDILVDRDIHATGRVKLTDFYRKTLDGNWQFIEPSEHLKSIGALDESSSYLGPQVIIPNYISGGANCITKTAFYSICCLNECNQVFEQLETNIASPVATSAEIVRAVESMPVPPTITSMLRTRLDEMAKVSDSGLIPLHGRLLAQWLHFAFPHECPYPHLTRKERKTHDQKISEEEIMLHLSSPSGHREPSPDAGIAMWKLQESLLPSSTPSDEQDSSRVRWLRLAVQLLMAGCTALIVLRELSRILRLRTQKKGKEYTV